MLILCIIPLLVEQTLYEKAFPFRTKAVSTTVNHRPCHLK